MRKSLIPALAAPAVLIATLAPASGASAAVSLPFVAVFRGAAAITGPTTTAFSGAGYATYLGRIGTDGHVQITGIDNSKCAGGVANTNTESLTAANGDTLTVTSTDVACPIGPTGSNRYHGSGSWVVTSGTGRFAHASGRGAFNGHSDFTTGTFDTTLAGRVRLGK